MIGESAKDIADPKKKALEEHIGRNEELSEKVTNAPILLLPPTHPPIYLPNSTQPPTHLSRWHTCAKPYKTQRTTTSWRPGQSSKPRPSVTPPPGKSLLPPTHPIHPPTFLRYDWRAVIDGLREQPGLKDLVSPTHPPTQP